MMESNVGMGTVRLISRMAEELQLAGKEEASFYFSQLEEHLRNGGTFDECQDVVQLLGL